MAQSSQSTPTVTANISGTRHQVNLRDYLNARVAPFLKKAITESLDASPEFPLQWLGENLIHQSMLFEGNPDSTGIRERFLYKFETPAPVPAAAAVQPAVSDDVPVQPEAEAGAATAAAVGASGGSVPVDGGEPASAPLTVQDTQMANHVNGEMETALNQREDDTRDTEMAGTS